MSSRRDGFRETIYRIPFGGVVRRTQRIAWTFSAAAIFCRGDLLLPKGRRRRLTHHHHHHRRHTLGADQIEFVYLFSPSSSSFAGMRLSLSSRRSRGNEEERSPQDKDKRTSTDQHHRFFLFPNHNRDPNKNTTGVARKDHQNVCCETEPKTREASRDSSGHLPSEWASEEEWRDVRRRQVDGRRGQLQRHVHER